MPDVHINALNKDFENQAEIRHFNGRKGWNLCQNRQAKIRDEY
ncbi:unnamed protein product [Brassica oleracea var. botrytis]